MYNFFRQNKNIIAVASSVFIVSMTSLLLFLNTTNGGSQQLRADVVDPSPVQSETDENKYRQLFQNQDDPLIVLGLDGNISFASWNFESATGFGDADLKSTPLFSLLHPDDLPTFFAAFGKVISTGKPVMMIGPFRVRDNKGVYHFNMGSVYPVIEDGKVTSIGVTTHDITNNLDQYIQPQSSQSGDAQNDDSILQDETTTDPVVQVPIKHINKAVKQNTANQQQQDAPPQPVKWQKPQKIHNDPAWITGDKLVQLLPFRLPLFPGHSLLAQQ